MIILANKIIGNGKFIECKQHPPTALIEDAKRAERIVCLAKLFGGSGIEFGSWKGSLTSCSSSESPEKEIIILASKIIGNG